MRLRLLEDFFYRLLRPHHWTRNYPTDMDWDDFVLDAINRGDVHQHRTHVAQVGGVTTWVSNYPYGFGTPHDYRRDRVWSSNRMPRASTADKLYRLLNDHS